MARKILYIAIMMAFFLVACQSTAASPTATLTDEGPSEQPEQVVPTQLPEATPIALAEPPGTQLEANCTVVSRLPTPSPTEQFLVPPVNETDWVKGAENAKVTIIEYGDFQ